MIPRPSQKDVLAEIRACDAGLTLKQEEKLLEFLGDCEYAGNGKYVVIVLNQSFGKWDKRVHPVKFA